MLYIFSDESGCFTFSREQGASLYFMVCTITTRSCAVGDDLIHLKRRVIHEGHFSRDAFHATDDPWPIRHRVFELIQQHDFRIDATILEKPKAQPHIRRTESRFYQYAWYYHLSYVAPKIVTAQDEVAISAASLETNRSKAHFKAAVNDVAQQVLPRTTWSVAFPAASTDPCIQVADYCAWAIQRKWERNDTTAYDMISDKISTEFDLWKNGTTYYY
jgi:hypothetical protein